MANEVSFKIRIDDSGAFKTVTADAEELGRAFDSVHDSARKLDKTVVESAAWSQIFEGISGVVRQLSSAMAGLTASYRAQIEAETKLATAMRNTMDASDAEIDGIKDVISQQESMGIVAGEVQTAAAQELATYLGLSSSLETIIPTMNDMIAQQLGLGASAESATQIATMLGKVMNGQTKALSRYGYEFSEAQEYILKFGDESERAAVLCQVVGESVGGMNKELARTDVGRQQQFANLLDNVKARLGSIAQAAQPVITGLVTISDATGGILQLKNAIAALSKVERLAAINTKVQAVAQRMLKVAGYEAAAGTMALKVATAALYATLTIGISFAIEGLILAFNKLGKAGKDAGEEMSSAQKAQAEYTKTSLDVRLELAEEITLLESLQKAKADTSKAVSDLNTKYGQIFGSHKTAAEWYDVLTKKSAAYAQQVGYEAKAKVLATQKAELEMQRESLKKNQQQAEKTYDDYPQKNNLTGKKLKNDAALAKQEVSKIDDEIKAIQSDLDICMSKMSDAAKEIGNMSDVTQDVDKDTKKYADAIDEYRKAVERAVQVNREFGGKAKDIDAQLDAMKSGIVSLINQYGAERAEIKSLIAEYRNLRNARNESLKNENALPAVSAKLPTSVSVYDKSALGGTKTLSTRATVSTPQTRVRSNAQLSDYEQALQLYKKLESQLSGALPSQEKAIRSQMEALKELYDLPKEGNMAIDDTITALQGLGSAMGSLSGIVGEGAEAWLQWGATMLQTIAQAIPQLQLLFTANAATAAAEAGQSVASAPYVGPVLAIAAIASIAAAMASLPKFAEGGLAYGPTLGLFGEYPGASSNPEVVAPLSKLKDIVAPSFSMNGEVEFKIAGRTLRGFLAKVERVNERGR